MYILTNLKEKYSNLILADVTQSASIQILNSQLDKYTLGTSLETLISGVTVATVLIT